MYYWSVYPSHEKKGEGAWVPNEYLNVRRHPDTPGAGQTFPRGTVVTEEHAVSLVRLFIPERRAFP